MLLTKTYSVLDHWVIEVSCIHGIDPTQSHLVYRTEIRTIRADLGDALDATYEALVYCSRKVTEGEIWDSIDCML